MEYIIENAIDYIEHPSTWDFELLSFKNSNRNMWVRDIRFSSDTDFDFRVQDWTSEWTVPPKRELIVNVVDYQQNLVEVRWTAWQIIKIFVTLY